MHRAVISATSARAMLDAFARLGLDACRIEREAGLTPSELADPDRQLPAAKVYTMWEVADRLWNRPGPGLFAGRAVPIGAYEVLDYLLLASDTLGDGDAGRGSAREAGGRIPQRPGADDQRNRVPPGLLRAERLLARVPALDGEKPSGVLPSR